MGLLKKKAVQSTLSTLLLVVLFTSAYMVRLGLDKQVGLSRSLISFMEYMPPKLVKALSFGFEPILGDLFWISTLYESSNAKDAKGGYETLYRMAVLTTTLAPRIELAYRYIGATLAMGGRSDLAEKLFRKGIQNKSKSWKMLMMAAWFFKEYKNDHMTAYRLYYSATRLDGSPDYFKSLVAKYAVDQIDQLQQRAALVVLREMYRMTTNPKVRKKIKRQIDRYFKLFERE